MRWWRVFIHYFVISTEGETLRSNRVGYFRILPFGRNDWIYCMELLRYYSINIVMLDLTTDIALHNDPVDLPFETI